MKKIILLSGILIASITVFCQNPLAEVEIIRMWDQRKDIPATPGTSYTWKIPGDTAFYFQPIAGKTVKAIITFTEDTTTPAPVLKLVADNVDAKFSTNSLGTNVINQTGWSHFNGNVSPNPSWTTEFHLRTCSFSSVANTTATYTFTGKKIEVLGELSNNKGIAVFKIDNGQEVVIDTYADTNVNNSSVLMSATFPQGQHTITIRVTGTKRAASSAASILIDSFKIYE